MRNARSAIPVQVLFLVAIAGCGGDDGGTTAPTGPPTINLSPATTTLSFIGQARAFRATVRDAAGQTLNTSVSWTSSDASVFTVDNSGTVTAVGNGSGQLQASAEGATATASVTVEQLPAVLAIVSGGGQQAGAGTTLPDPIVVQVTDEGGTGVSGIAVSFEPGEGAGSVSPQNAVSDANGESSTEWTLGEGSFGNQSLRVSIEQGAATVVNARAVPENPIPDLAIEGVLTVMRNDPTDLETVEIGVQVVNRGNGPTPAVFPMALQVDGTVVDTYEVAQLAAEARVTLSYTVGPLEAGNHEIAMVLDPDNEIEEWTEDNNRSSALLPVAHQEVVTVGWSGQVSATRDEVLLFRLDVDETVDEVLTVRLQGGAAGEDADLFLHHGDRPDHHYRYKCISGSPTSVEVCQTAPTRAGSYHIAVHAFSTIGPTTMTVSVGEEVIEPYDIDLVFVSNGTSSQDQVVRDAAELWESIIAAGVSDLDFSDEPEPAGECGPDSPPINDVVDDIRIYVSIDSIDGAGQILGQSTPCFVRALPIPGYERTNTTIAGRITLDEADVARLETQGTLAATMVHELAHVLGFGTIWDSHELLANPSVPTNPTADVHFTGPLATAAFDAAGGSRYTRGAKVPVESGADPGRSDAHWRNSVFGMELMTPYISSEGSTLSAITIESFADLGHAVNLDEAENYRLPGSGQAGDAMKGTIIDLSGDILYTPIKKRDTKWRPAGVIYRR